MYLSLLKEKHKKMFLNIAYKIALADGEFHESEKKMINSYCLEMQIIFNEDEMTKSIDEIINVLKDECSEQEKRIIIFECIGLALTDNNYDTSEKEFVDSMATLFDIKSDFLEECEKVISDYISFQNRVNTLVIN